MQEFDPKDFKVNTNYVIRASAGTGKTYNIVEIVDKLVDHYDLSEIAIVTYTEKAAEELKNRIGKKIGSSKNVDIDNATIGTIHSFCKRTIEEFFISSGKMSDMSLIDEAEIRDFIKEYIRVGNIKSEIEAAIINGSENVEENVINIMSVIINDYYLDDNYKENMDVIGLDPIYSECYFKKKNFRTAIPMFDKDLAVLGNSTDATLQKLYKEILPISDLNDIQSNTTRLKATCSQSEVESYSRIRGYIHKIKEANKDLKDESFRIAFKYCADVYEQWIKQKTLHKQQSFNDMIRSVHEEVVAAKPLLYRLREKYKYIIIDEFQDTNQLQWDIFSKVFLCDDHYVIVVGDEKQSIYKFQGADVSVFDKAISEIVSFGGEETCLSNNYRSSESLIECTTKMFSNVFPSFAPSNQATDNQQMKAVVDGKDVEAYWVAKTATDADSFAQIVCQTIVDCCSFDSSNRTKLQLIDAMGNARNVSFKDFAVLARTRSELQLITDALRNSGIPLAQYKDKDIFTGVECADLATVLDAIDTPNFSSKYRGKFKKALFTEFFKYELHEISSDEFEKENVEEINLFEKWKEIAKEERWEDLIDRIFADTSIKARLGSLNDAKKLSVIKQLGDYCVDFLMQNHSIHMLVKNLNSGNPTSTSDGDMGKAKFSDFDSVQVMTAHASKGLEFPIVISGYGFKRKYTDSNLWSRVIKYHNEYGNNVIGFDKKALSIEETEEAKRLMYVAYTRPQYILILHNAKSDGVYSCISNGMSNYQGNCRELVNNNKNYDELKKDVEIILSRNNIPANAKDELDQRAVAKKLKDGIYWHNSFKHAYSSLSHSKAAPVTISNTSISVNNGEDEIDAGLSEFDKTAVQIPCEYDATIEPITLCDGYPAGAGLGNAVHDVLEVTDYSKACDIDLVEKCFKGQGLKKNTDWFNSTKDMVDELVEAKLPVIHGSKANGDSFTLSSVDFDHRRNEVEFNFNKENELLKRFFNGFVDLIIRKDDYFSILDWKSDRLNDDFTAYNDGVILKEHVDKKYAIQRVLYSYTLIKWLKNFYKDLTEEEIFDKHFGGVYYVFIRGCNKGTGNGIYAQTWESYKALKDAYDNIVKKKIG